MFVYKFVCLLVLCIFICFYEILFVSVCLVMFLSISKEPNEFPYKKKPLLIFSSYLFVFLARARVSFSPFFSFPFFFPFLFFLLPLILFPSTFFFLLYFPQISFSFYICFLQFFIFYFFKYCILLPYLSIHLKIILNSFVYWFDYSFVCLFVVVVFGLFVLVTTPRYLGLKASNFQGLMVIILGVL